MLFTSQPHYNRYICRPHRSPIWGNKQEVLVSPLFSILLQLLFDPSEPQLSALLSPPPTIWSFTKHLYWIGDEKQFAFCQHFPTSSNKILWRKISKPIHLFAQLLKMAVTHVLLGASALFAEDYCPPRSTYWGRSHIYSISSNWLSERELQKVIFPTSSQEG